MLAYHLKDRLEENIGSVSTKTFIHLVCSIGYAANCLENSDFEINNQGELRIDHTSRANKKRYPLSLVELTEIKFENNHIKLKYGFRKEKETEYSSREIYITEIPQLLNTKKGLREKNWNSTDTERQYLFEQLSALAVDSLIENIEHPKITAMHQLMKCIVGNRDLVNRIIRDDNDRAADNSQFWWIAVL